MWEIRERGLDGEDSDPDLKIAKYLKKLEYERALRNKWKNDREKEIEQSLELRLRRGQARLQMKTKLTGSQIKTNLKNSRPKVISEKERDSKSMLKVP